jgi:hypothetical protein
VSFVERGFADCFESCSRQVFVICIYLGEGEGVWLVAERKMWMLVEDEGALSCTQSGL